MTSPYQVTKDFEAELRGYCGAPYAVAVNSCTAAILLALIWWQKRHTWVSDIECPSHTYPSVPMSIRRAKLNPKFVDTQWRGAYRLPPSDVWDCARRFTSGMYVSGQFQCVSFSSSKILGIEQGGAILHDNRDADIWFRKMRFDGRTEGVDPKDDTFDLIGYHCLMLPSIAAQLILKLHHLPRHNDDLPDYPYPDLSRHPAFR